MDRQQIAEGMERFLKWHRINELLNNIHVGDIFKVSDVVLKAMSLEDIGFYPGARKENGKIDLSKIFFLVSKGDQELATISIYASDSGEIKVRAKNPDVKSYIPDIKTFFAAKAAA